MAYTAGKEIIPLITQLCNDLSGLDVMFHVATKYHNRALFVSHCVARRSVGVSSYVVVSGCPQGDFDTLFALDAIRDEGYDVWFAYNLFLNGVYLEVEQLRLFHKLGYEHVRGVAFYNSVYAQAETQALLKLYRQLGVATFIDIIPF